MIDKLLKEFEKENLSPDDKLKIYTALLNKIGALPIESIIAFSEGNKMKIQGKTIDVEQAHQISLSAAALKENISRKIIKDQLKWLAINQGIHKATNHEGMMFAKAALWLIEEEEQLVNRLAK